MTWVPLIFWKRSQTCSLVGFATVKGQFEDWSSCCKCHPLHILPHVCLHFITWHLFPKVDKMVLPQFSTGLDVVVFFIYCNGRWTHSMVEFNALRASCSAYCQRSEKNRVRSASLWQTAGWVLTPESSQSTEGQEISSNRDNSERRSIRF